MSDTDLENESGNKQIDEDDELIEEFKTTGEDTSIGIEYADVIEIVSPSNSEYNERTFFIDYIDDFEIKLIDAQTLTQHKLSLDENSNITDESITEIRLVSRSDAKGYAVNNGLLKLTWIDVHFTGEFPIIITGQITNVDFDRIEITIYPSLEIIYIDFEYKGIPKNIPIDKIIIRERPNTVKTKSIASASEISENEPEEKASVEYTDMNEMIVSIPENYEPDIDVRETLRSIYINADNIVFGEEEETVSQLVELSETERTYTIDAQVNSLLDELLSTVPDNQRTRSVMTNIHIIIERFKELRDEYSIFDNAGNVRGFSQINAMDKPLIDRLISMDTDLKWITPVVSCRRKVYDVGLSESGITDIIDLNGDDEISRLRDIQNDYFNNGLAGDASKYKRMVRQTDDVLDPFENPLFPNNSINGGKSSVLCNIDTVIGSLEDFYSTVVEKSKVTRRKFVIQRYNLGSTDMERLITPSGKKVFVRKNLTKNDDMVIKSLIVFPEPIVRFSRVSLPTTSIMDRAILGNSFILLFRLLHKNIKINQEVVDTFDKELDYGSDSVPDFIDNVREYVLDQELVDSADNDTYRKFLEVLIPNTRNLIRLIQKFSPNSFSMLEAIRILEPFMIYSKNITHDQYSAIKTFVKESIATYKSTIKERGDSFNLYRSTNFGVDVMNNMVETLLKEKKSAMDVFIQEYNLHNAIGSETRGRMGYSTSSETISYIFQRDNAMLFSTLLKFILVSLRLPSGFIDTKTFNSSDESSDMGRLESIKPSDCNRRFLTKKYKSLSELQKDNNAIIFYDKEYDDTPYTILSVYKKARANYTEPEFLEFLATNLVLNHNCPPSMSKETADTLVSGKKPVKDGEYAIFEMRPRIPQSPNSKDMSDKHKIEIEIEEKVRTVTSYYRRKNNHWVKDDTVLDTSFMDNNMLFCNINESCVKNSKTSTCDTLTDSSQRIKTHLSLEADERFTRTIDELERDLEGEINHHIANINGILRLRYVQSHRANNLAYEIGKLYVVEENIVSPHAGLRDFIISQGDFSKKQHDIVRFVENGRFCRQPMLSVIELNESPFWIYCVTTNRELIPMFMYTLAKTYIMGDNFQQSLDKICRIQGVISDDNDAIVDKHSGYVIRKIEFSSEEGFDEFGYKISTSEIMERDISLVVSEALRQKDEVFGSELSQLIYNIFVSLCGSMGVHTNAIQDFVLITSNNCIMQTVMSEAMYEKSVQNRLKKDPTKKPIPYTLYRNQTIIISVASVILIAVQTAVPAYNPQLTVPGCVMSFDGYPMEGGESDIRGVRYIACVLNRSKSSLAPWNSIKNMPIAIIESSMKRILVEYLMASADITGITVLYTKKKEYLITVMDGSVPKELDVKKWFQFVPPIFKFSVIKSLHGLTSEFKTEFSTLIKRGDPKQWNSIAALKTNVIMHGYAVIELINKVVGSKELIFKTTSNIPFMQNSCCNEITNNKTALEYFIKEDANIQKHIDIIRKSSEILFDTRNYAVAPIFFHNINTTISRPPVQTSNFDDNIYRTFIHYCKFDSNIPIPMILRTICPEKPTGYNPTWSLYEKISFFKRTGRIYGEKDLDRIMTVVALNNMVEIENPPTYRPDEVIINLMEQFEAKNSSIIESPLRNHIINVFADRSSKTLVSENNEHISALKNYLTLSNRRMIHDITTFIKKYGNMTSSETNKAIRTIDSMSIWDIDIDISKPQEYSQPGLYTAVQFVKNSIFNMTKVFPHIITNAVSMSLIPKHWNLSQIHQRDIYAFTNKYHTKFSEYKKDEVLGNLLNSVGESMSDIILFLDHLPISTPMFKDGNTFYRLLDKSTIYLLVNYCWLSVLYEYVQMSNDPEYLRQDVRVINNMMETARDERFDTLSTTRATYRTMDEAEVDIMSDINEVQINIGNTDELKERVASLITTYVTINRETKSHIDQTYDAFMEKTSRSKTAEKETITDLFKNMDTEERRAENLMKQMKMGRWNVGLQKGVVEYDKAMYDKEREESNELFIEEGMVSELVGDMDERYFAEVGVGMRDVDDMENYDEAIADEEADEEAFNISGLDNDYLDDYYGDGNGDDGGFGYED